MENKIKMKQFILYFTVLVTFVLLFGNEAVGFTNSADDKVNVSEANPADSLPLSSAWVQTNWPVSNSFFNLCGSKNKVFARTWDSFNGGRMFFTNNDGTNWNQVSSADSNIDILSIVLLDSRILAGTWNGFIQSTDDGKTWDAFTTNGIPADAAIWSIVIINSTLFAGTTGDIYKSTDNGNTWTKISSGIEADARITSIVASGDNIFAGSANNGVFKSTNNGTSWTAINSNLTNTNISQLLILDHKLFAVTLTDVYQSDNSGTSWAADSSGLKNVNCIVAVKDQIIAGTDDKGAFLSVDKGETWTSFNSGMPADTRIWSLAVSSDGIFAGTSSGIWFTSSPTQVGIDREISVPLTFTLKQNYPNPFNSSTTISFSILTKSFVSLKIYDRQGREVATILSEEIPAGNYTRKWDAADFSNGIYFYRLQAGSYSEAKKLILLR
jgi:photosystem II stability/assembly factor-like uncharacterized protein